MNLRDSYTKESFVNFQNHPQASGTSVYIPQYTSNQTEKELSLYDNIYFDTKNGTLIEVFANSCLSNCSTDPKSITDIVVASRNGLGITAIPTVFDNAGNVKPNATAQSFITTIDPMYNQYVYTTSCKNTSLYQVFYTSWNKDTYVHIVDLSANSGSGKNVKSFFINSSGIASSQNTFTTPSLQPYKMSASTVTENKNAILPSNVDPKYLQAKAPLLQLGKDENLNSVSYDVSNGNIVVSSAGKYTIYNRNGNTINNTQPNNQWEKIPNINTFVINDISGLSVLTTSYNDDTVIQLVVPEQKTNSYRLLYTYRFNKYTYVTNFETDTKNNPALTPAPTTGAPVPTTMSSSKNLDKNNISNLDGDASKNTSSVCGDDISCKWYWYFHTIAQKNGNDSTYFSDDYFLKTEAVPPVCPQCPQCPSSGTCNNCGGGGGCGTVGVAGGIKDKSGGVYVPYTDSSGNTRYVLSSSGPEGPSGGPGGPGGGPDNMTMVDKNGVITSANPNTIAGGLTTTALGLGQVGSTGLTTAGDVANNLVNTAGGAVGSVTNLAGGAINSATGLVGGLANTAGNVVGGLGNVVGGLGTTAGNVIGGAVNTVGNLGHLGNDGRWNQGQGAQGQGVAIQQGQGQSNAGSASGSSLGYTGYTPGYTPIDNYSNYGALQSKGGNYMPVTADFSSFRK